MAANAINLRAVRLDDSERIFAWRNRPEIVALGSLQRSVSWEEHASWFQDTLIGELRALYIVEEDGQAIGQIRFDWQGKRQGEVSIYLLPEFMGRGLGVAALWKGCQLAFASGRAGRISAHIRKENPRSLATFIKVGFFPSRLEEARPGHDCLCLYPRDQVVPHNRLTYGEEEVEAVASVVRSGNWTSGTVSARLETRLATCAGAAGAVAVGSGLGALRLALLALGIKVGDAVAVPAYSCVALANAALACGAQPVPVDVEPDTWNISPTALRAARNLHPNMKAIIAVHTFGVPARVSELASTGLPVVEDCSHAFGVEPFGRLGEIAILSLYATKLMGSGQGGALLSKNPDILVYGRSGRDYVDKAPSPLNLNDRNTDIEASLALCQLDRLPVMLKRRRELAECYRKGLKSRQTGKDVLRLPLVTPERIWYRFAVSVPDAAKIVDRMKSNGVDAAQPVDNWLGDKIRDHPVSEQAYRTLVSLPLYPSLTEFEQQRAMETFLNAVSDN